MTPQGELYGGQDPTALGAETERPCRPCQLDQHDHCLHPSEHDPQECCCDLLERSP